ncbi:MAG: hypothetical protein IPF42_16975 [Candidatus Microthrix sp.]|nr:hypothetical protein [Candidatus Microthrix sp.]
MRYQVLSRSAAYKKPDRKVAFGIGTGWAPYLVPVFASSSFFQLCLLAFGLGGMSGLAVGARQLPRGCCFAGVCAALELSKGDYRLGGVLLLYSINISFARGAG